MADVRRNERGIRGGGRRRSGLGERNGKKRIFLWLMLALLAVNVLLFMGLRSRMRAVNENLNRMTARLSLLEGEMGVPVSAPAEDDAGGAEASGAGTAAGYPDRVALDSVDRPRERTYGEIISRLEALGKENGDIKTVVENAEAYPQQLLEALANNPEMAGFAADFLEKKGTVTGGGLTEEEKAEKFPLFLQWDPRWGYASYGDDSVVGLSGCGPTALSMALWYLTGNEDLTPDKLADYSMKHGYYISGTGTAWLLMENVPPHYGIGVEQPEASEWVLDEALAGGSIVICSMGPGDFTVGGHFIVLYGRSEDGYLLNDPNCVARSRRAWTWGELEDQIKHIWVLYNS